MLKEFCFWRRIKIFKVVRILLILKLDGKKSAFCAAYETVNTSFELEKTWDYI